MRLCLQGGLDRGLDIPHSEKRFVGYNSEDKKLDAESLKHYIYGGNVSDYMEWLQEENGDKFNTHFAKAVAEDLEADGIEDMYRDVSSFASSFTCTHLLSSPHLQRNSLKKVSTGIRGHCDWSAERSSKTRQMYHSVHATCRV